ncbi:hypothetical protein [Bradyrhizobium sp. F1.13.3]|uniref:hypothetical protein n=1 Tax=Bradyrhizobium sp. F1.13.3 TaxID=3156351 RepID=UPI0033917AE9
MESTIIGELASRREAELAVERLVQECAVARGDVFVQPVGASNSSGTRSAGADVKAVPRPEGQKLDGEIEVDFDGDEPDTIAEALKGAGAKAVRTN